MSNDPVITLVLKLNKLGKTPLEIATRINKPEYWVESIIEKHNNSNVPLPLLKKDEPLEDDGTEIWSIERKEYERDRMVPLAFKLWLSALTDESAPWAIRMRASENLMKYEQELKASDNEDAEKVTYLQFTDEQMAMLKRLRQEEKEYGEF